MACQPVGQANSIQSSQTNFYELTIALATLASAIVIKTLRPRWPGLLMALVVGTLISLWIDGGAHEVRLLGKLPGRLPPLSSPDFILDSKRHIPE
jgi:SulP family sulfate permease